LKRFAGFAVVVSKLRCDIESYLENVFCCAAAQNLDRDHGDASKHKSEAIQYIYALVLSSLSQQQQSLSVITSMIPHPPIFLSEIRLTDIYLLLSIGFVWELLQRLVLLLVCRRKPTWLRRQEAQLIVLQNETTKQRNIGPSAFVETSKLERECLAQERKLASVYESRKKRTETIERLLLRYGNLFVAFVVFVGWYGVPILTIEGLDSVLSSTEEEEVIYSSGSAYVDGSTYLKALLFPISYVGFGMKMSKWGMDKELAQSSLGALAVMWSAQSTCSMLMDAVDAFWC
jgi:hypothetical protein